MAIPKADTFRCDITIKGGGRSFKEKYPLKDTGGNRAAAIAVATNLVKCRRLIMADGVSLHYAAVHDGDGEPDRSLVISSPVSGYELDTEAGPPIALTAFNDIKSTLHITFETALGRWVNRQIAGLRDGWMSAGLLTFTPTVFATGTFAPGTHAIAGLTKEVAMGSFIGFLRDYVTLHRPVTKTTVEILDLPTWAIRGASSRDRGTSAFGGRGRAKVLENK